MWSAVPGISTFFKILLVVFDENDLMQGSNILFKIPVWQNSEKYLRNKETEITYGVRSNKLLSHLHQVGSVNVTCII